MSLRRENEAVTGEVKHFRLPRTAEEHLYELGYNGRIEMERSRLA